MIENDNPKRIGRGTQGRGHWIVIFIVALVAMVVQLYSTSPNGIGVGHDSVLYLNTAENISDGEGVNWTGGGGQLKPLIHFPPLYPLLLSLGSSFGGTVAQIAAWSTALLFGISVFLIGAIIYSITSSWRAAFLGEFFLLLSPSFFAIYLDAMSEPLYLALTASVLLLLTAYLVDQKRWKINLAAIFASLAFLTRYIGASLVVTGVISLLIFFPGTSRKKITEAVRFGAIGMAINIVWTIRNYSLTASFTNRVFGFHPIGKEKINEAISTLSGWLFPKTEILEMQIATTVFIILLVLGIAYSILFLPQRINSIKANVAKKVVLLHGFLYAIFLFISLTFFDASTRMSSRILAPLLIIAFVLLIVEGYSIMKPRISASLEKSELPIIVVGLIAIILFAPTTLDLIADLREQGRGFNSLAWQNSEIIAKLRAMEPNSTIYTNEAFAVLYLTGIPALRVPEKVDPVDGSERSNFEKLFTQMKERLQDPNSALAVFHQGYLRPGIPSLDEMSQGLVLFHQSHDGVILQSE